jgi:hypothetical protein
MTTALVSPTPRVRDLAEEPAAFASGYCPEAERSIREEAERRARRAAQAALRAVRRERERSAAKALERLFDLD